MNQTPQNPIQVAAQRGYPSALFGFTPAQRGYWFEPGLPFWTEALRQHPPLDYRGNPLLPFVAQIAGERMAPRFAAGVRVMLVPVFERKNLVVGKVYTYSYRNEATGELEMMLGRLVKIGGNYLEVAPDNPGPDEADRTIWLLREQESEAVWDVREVSHYVDYPGEE